MKKVLVLILVLGMASVATAVPLTMLSFRVGGSDVTSFNIPTVGASVVIQLYSDATEADPSHMYTALVAIPPGDSRTNAKITGYTIESGTVTHSMANVSVTLADYVYNADNSGSTVETLTAGVGFTFTIEGKAIGTGTINLRESATTVDTLSFTVLPEPATMALLGLGGLLLRRRK